MNKLSSSGPGPGQVRVRKVRVRSVICFKFNRLVPINRQKIDWHRHKKMLKDRQAVSPRDSPHFQICLQTTSSGCQVPVCQTRCPKLKDPSCSKCFLTETFVNATLCSCEELRCVAKSCPAATKLRAADFPCHVIQELEDDCGCTQYKANRNA